MKWQQLILAFIATICLIFAGNALAQTDININNTNLIRFGGSVTVAENQTVESARAFGGSVRTSFICRSTPRSRWQAVSIAAVLNWFGDLDSADTDSIFGRLSSLPN
jgi:hypothetical protein